MTFRTYTPRRPTVTAAQVTGTEDNLRRIAEWCGGYLATPDNDGNIPLTGTITVPTLSGTIPADWDDFIVRDGHGRFTIRTSHAFHRTFTPHNPGQMKEDARTKLHELNQKLTDNRQWLQDRDARHLQLINLYNHPSTAINTMRIAMATNHIPITARNHYELTAPEIIQGLYKAGGKPNQYWTPNPTTNE